MSIRTLTILSILLALGLFVAACGETGQEDEPDGDGDTPEDGDTPDGDAPEDGDDPLAPTGSGTCADPIIHPGPERGTRTLDGNGFIEDYQAQVDTGICLDEDDTETEVKGLGPEVVVKVSLDGGDRVSVSFIGDEFNGLIMVRTNVCATGRGCEKVTDQMGVAGFEALTFVAPYVGNYFLIFDSVEENPTGYFSYHIEIKAADDQSGAGEGLVGSACSAGADCVTNFCLTTTLLAWLVEPEENLEIKNGYCTVILCYTDGSDGTCQPDSGGLCVPIPEFAGELFRNRGLCLDLCERDSDCRIEDDMRCFDPQEYVDQGLLDQTVKDSLYDGLKACLPNSLIQAGAGELAEM